MKKLIAFLVVAAIAVYGVVQLTKGSPVETEKPALCIVMEADDLFPAVDFNSMREKISAVVEKCGYIRLVVADGSPFTAVDVDIPTPDKKYTKSKQKKLNEDLTDHIIEMMNDAATVRPKTAENDLLAGIKRGKQELARCQSATRKDLIVIASGISRAGNLRFQEYVYDNGSRTTNALLTAKPEEIVAELLKNYAVPNLSGVDSLTWYGLGAFAGAQKVPDSVIPKLETLWTAITDEAGCPVDFGDLTLQENPPQTDTHSAVIDFGEDKLVVDISKLEVSLDEKALGFEANLAELKDVNKAKSIVAPFAELMCQSDDAELYLVGLTATFGNDLEHCVELSEARAQVVKGLLVMQGVPESRLHVIGLGQGGSVLRVDDTIDADVDTLEQLREQNRVVWLLGQNSSRLKALDL